MSTDREVLLRVVQAGEALLAGDAVDVFARLATAVDAARAHLATTRPHDCSTEVARASAAAYAAGQARNAGATP